MTAPQAVHEGERPSPFLTARDRGLIHARAVDVSAAADSATWTWVAAIWAASRAFFFAVGAIGHYVVPQAQIVGDHPASVGSLSYWAHWDGRWFSLIANSGYDTATSTAFFPLYPALVRVGAGTGVGVAVAGVVISTLATLVGFYFVFVLARHWYGHRAAVMSLLAVAVFPTAFYFNAVYSEPLFLALAAGSMWATYLRRDLFLAGALAFGAALTRNVGIALALPIAYEWCRNRSIFRWHHVLAAAGPVLGLASYVLYVQHKIGAGGMAQAQQDRWGRSLSSPLETLARALEHAADGVAYLSPSNVFSTPSFEPPYALSNTLNVWFLVFALSAIVLGVRRLPRGVLLYSAVVALVPLAFPEGGGLPLMSYSRLVLVAFPLFFVVGAGLARRPALAAVWIAASASLGAYLTVLFATWRWVA